MDAFHHNWIDGELVGAATGDTFDVMVGGGRGLVGRWPRANERDLRTALLASERGAARWSRLSRSERAAHLSRAIDTLFAERDEAIDLCASAVGLTGDEVEALFRPLDRALDEVLADRDPSLYPFQRTSGAQVFALDWSEMWLAPTRFAFRALLEGRAVVLVSDPRAPMVADHIGRALRDLPPGTVSVLHDDGRTLVRAAGTVADVGGLHLASTADACAELARRSEPEKAITIQSGFGAGVEVTQAPRLNIRPLKNQSAVLDDTDDPRVQAEDIVARAFSRVGALSGSAPGRVGRVLVPVRRFSRFTEELLSVLEHDGDARDPMLLTRRLALHEVERATALGHDEGATAIFTGFENSDLPFPLVFTNVEERMRLTQLARPSPVLCLMRVADEARGRALATAIDV